MSKIDIAKLKDSTNELFRIANDFGFAARMLPKRDRKTYIQWLQEQNNGISDADVKSLFVDLDGESPTTLQITYMDY